MKISTIFHCHVSLPEGFDCCLFFWGASLPHLNEAVEHHHGFAWPFRPPSWSAKKMISYWVINCHYLYILLFFFSLKTSRLKMFPILTLHIFFLWNKIIITFGTCGKRFLLIKHHQERNSVQNRLLKFPAPPKMPPSLLSQLQRSNSKYHEKRTKRQEQN